ncbi:GerAB/ArcD/ProY family transporter [Halalkalibacter urbisdiaboli]|uniref:GerAB/ArcD/ProY family transporter n=1 Tax=Halalkalibacter urbisdiaboli TaxID=1960589 RepID=UPI000B443643|nr:GerAB/ArcD/ProY family transporter [Halalkalibacter urbisdiaboli]
MNTARNETLSLWQFFLLVIVFTIGTTVVVGRGDDAKQDIWIAEIIAVFFGVGLVYFYYFVLKRGGGKNLYGLLVQVFGTKLGYVIVFGYANYFIYISTRNIRDFGELIKVTLMPVTPLEIISLSMMGVVFYVLFNGLEVLGKINEVLGPFLMTFLVLVGVMIFITGEIDVTNIQPVLAEGIKPIVKAFFPTMLTFPYGETVVFMVMMTSVSRFTAAGKTSAAAIVVSGLLIVYSNVVQITTLGEDVRNRSIFPLMVAAREIALLEFFERVDILVVFILMIGILIKVSVFFYAGVKGLEFLFHIPYRYLMLPITLLIPLFSSFIADHIVSHFEEGLLVVPYFLHLPFQIGIPLFLLIVLLIKQKMKIKGKRGEKHENL